MNNGEYCSLYRGVSTDFLIYRSHYHLQYIIRFSQVLSWPETTWKLHHIYRRLLSRCTISMYPAARTFCVVFCCQLNHTFSSLSNLTSKENNRRSYLVLVSKLSRWWGLQDINMKISLMAFRKDTSHFQNYENRNNLHCSLVLVLKWMYWHVED
jgi:hypothetical protein